MPGEAAPVDAGLVRVGMKERVHCMRPCPVPHTRLKMYI
jgi:hypothetical protein